MLSSRLTSSPRRLSLTIRESRKRMVVTLRRKHSRNHRPGSLFFCRAFSRLFSWRASNSPRATIGVNEMRRRQTEIYYQSEPAYLKSVLLWLQEYWTEPAPRFYPLNQVEQESRYSSALGGTRHIKSARRDSRF